MNENQPEKKQTPGLEEALKATAQHIDDLSSMATHQIEQTVEQGKAKLNALQEGLRNATEDVAREADYFVHEHPWQAVGIAAGVGLIVGLFLHRD